jgi:hypothetical protein
VVSILVGILFFGASRAAHAIAGPGFLLQVRPHTYIPLRAFRVNPWRGYCLWSRLIILFCLLLGFLGLKSEEDADYSRTKTPTTINRDFSDFNHNALNWMF